MARYFHGAAHYAPCVTVVQVPNQQLHHLAANTGQRLPLHMQLNGTSHLSARPQAYSAGLANATYIPGTGLQYGGAAPHLHQRAPIPHHASDASYLQQDPQALAAAAAAAANAAVYKRTAGLPPHIQQQLLRSGQVLPNQAAPRPPNGLLFETNDIDLSGTLSMLNLQLYGRLQLATCVVCDCCTCVCTVNARHLGVCCCCKCRLCWSAESVLFGCCRLKLLCVMYQHVVMFTGWCPVGNMAGVNLQICTAMYSFMSQSVSPDSHMSSHYLLCTCCMQASPQHSCRC